MNATNVIIAPASSSTNSTTTHGHGNATVKTEKSKGSGAGSSSAPNEYDEWARKLVSRPIPQLQPNSNNNNNSSSTNSNNNGGLSVTNLLFQSANGANNSSGQQSSTMLIGNDGLPPHHGFDIDSAIGRFTWITVDEDKYIPALFRLGDTFACVRMIEVSVINLFSNLLPPEIYDGAKINSHFVTPAEAKLLNYINSFHCDGLYGGTPFTTSDLLISTSEMEKFYWYLNFAYNVLGSGGRNQDNDFENCGFVEVNKSLIPYAVLEDGEKAVPLFYFEGQVDILKTKAHSLRGWKLAYLKICCRVQGVRKDLITADELLIVHLSDLKSYFPKRTVFTENSWPVPRSTKSLLLKPGSSAHNQSSSFSSSGSGSYSHTRWTKPLTNEGYFSTEKSNSSSLTARTISITGLTPTATATPRPTTQINVRAMQPQPPSLVPSSSTNPTHSHPLPYNNHTRQQQQQLFQPQHQQQSQRSVPSNSAAAKFIQQLHQANVNARFSAHPYANVNVALNGYGVRR